MCGYQRTCSPWTPSFVFNEGGPARIQGFSFGKALIYIQREAPISSIVVTLARLLTKGEPSGVMEIKWLDLSLYTARFPAHGSGDH